MARRKKTELPKTELNITSMMDLVLNLLTFFVLCSNLAMAELPPMEPPQPNKSKARPTEAVNKFTINILPNKSSPGDALSIKFGSSIELPRDAAGELTALIAAEKAKSPDVGVDLRADRSLRYDQVAPVMAAIKASGVTRINVVAQIDQN
jgi:biopolymer transport protein ExbD